MHMPTDIDQNAIDIDKKIRDFMDRKTSPWRALSEKIAERLAPAVYRKTSNEGITYETLRRTSAISRG